MRVFEGLRFRRADSPIHRLDPRVKFVMSSVMFVLAFMFVELVSVILLFLSQIPLVLLARVKREWLRTLRGSTILVFLIFITNLAVGYFSADYRLTSGVLTYSATMAIRFLALTASFSIFFLTTSPDELGLALEQTHIPYEFCFAFTTAIRFVPVLAIEAQTIMDAQRSRGLELDKGSFLKRVRNYVPILIPLIVGAIRRSLELAEAMESRAFGAKRRRTNLYVLRMQPFDYLTLSTSILVLAAAVYVKLTVPIPVVEIPSPF